MHTRDYSDHTSKIIDDEVERILREQEARAIEVLTLHRRGLEALAHALLEHETLDGEAAAHSIDEAHGEPVHAQGTKTVSSLSSPRRRSSPSARAGARAGPRAEPAPRRPGSRRRYPPSEGTTTVRPTGVVASVALTTSPARADLISTDTPDSDDAIA